MQIQINTDHNIKGHEAMTSKFSSVVENALSRFSDHITRVEIHLSDENGDKSGQNDKRCMIEARLKGSKPIAVTHHAKTLELAVDGASEKLFRVIENSLGRIRDKKNSIYEDSVSESKPSEE